MANRLVRGTLELFWVGAIQLPSYGDVTDMNNLGIGFVQFCVPGVLAFQANITSHSKRAVASATCLIGGGIGGVIASVVFMARENPHYTVCGRPSSAAQI